MLFEDLFEAVNIQAEKWGEKEDPKPSITSLNKTNTCDWYDFNIDIINDDEYNALQKESLMLFEGFCIFGFWEFFIGILMEVNKTMYGNNEDVPKKVFGQFVSRITLMWCHICSCVECPCGRWKHECQSTINELNFKVGIENEINDSQGA